MYSYNVSTEIIFFVFPDGVSSRVHIRNHYRAHKLSMWLHLIPKLHAAGSTNVFPQVQNISLLTINHVSC